VTHGASTRQPVYSGNRRIPGLYQRTLASGAMVFEFAGRLGGKVRRHRLAATTKTDAINEARALHVDYTRGESHRSPAAGLTVAELAGDWLEHLESRVDDRDPRRRYSPKTVRHYRQQLRTHVFPELGARPVSDVAVQDLRRLVDRLSKARLSPSSITGSLTITSGLFRFAVRNGLAERNPVRDLDRSDRPGSGRVSEPRYLTPPELERLLATMAPTFRPVAAACAYAGLRISEALALRWCDLDFDGGTINVTGQLGTGGERLPTKTLSSIATVPMLPALARELREHRSRLAGLDLRRVHASALVFVTSTGRPQSARNALRALYAAGDKAGLNGDGREPVGLHDLRHTYAAIALEAEATLPETAALLRHKNPRVTMQTYAGLAEGGREKAAAKLVEAGFGR
jgi:integrase